jgi:hypothetical protein
MKLLLKIKSWIIKTFTSVRKELKVIIPIAISVVNGIKQFVDSTGADFLTSVIPGTVDDQVKAFLRSVLPGILKGLKKWESIVNVQDENEQLKLIVEELKTLTKSERDNIKTQIASEVVVKLSEFSGQIVDINDAKIMTLTAYNYPEVLSDEKKV